MFLYAQRGACTQTSCNLKQLGYKLVQQLPSLLLSKRSREPSNYFCRTPYFSLNVLIIPRIIPASLRNAFFSPRKYKIAPNRLADYLFCIFIAAAFIIDDHYLFGIFTRFPLSRINYPRYDFRLERGSYICECQKYINV